jgi:hypothetical protein
MPRARDRLTSLFGANVSTEQESKRAGCLTLQPEHARPLRHHDRAKEYTFSSCRPERRARRHYQTGENVKRTGNVARVCNATARRALLQAKRVPWPHLAEAAEEYTGWHVFTLWARAIIDAANNVPAVIRSEIELRAPGVYKSLHPKVRSAINCGDRPGIVAWEDITCWAEMNLFLSAKREGWLDAVRYFSAMSLRSMKAWSHWERIDTMWRRSPPRQFPTPQEWDRAVTSVARLSNADSAAQRALEVVQSMRDSDWQKLLVGFSRLNTFSQWMELMLNFQDSGTDQVSMELMNRYPGLHPTVPRMAPKEAVRSLKSWVLSNEIPGAKSTGVPGALRFHLHHHPEFAAIRRYAQFSRGIWADHLPNHLPTFAEWKQAADGYSEAC